MLTRLQVTGVRNLEPVTLEPHPTLNVIHGENASGKTSLLEAVSILSSGRSFRTNSLEHAVNHTAAELQVFGQSGNGDRVGYRWGGKAREIRINGESANRLSQLAQALPLQWFTPDTHINFIRSRQQRISTLDWTLFHVEHRFHEIWSRYRRLREQRNAALKAGQTTGAWDTELVEQGERITRHRQQALELLTPAIERYAAGLPDARGVSVRLRQGWNQEKTLAQALADDRERDRKEGFTHSGPHRGDLEVLLDGHKVREEASQGQLKMIVLALRLAQVDTFCQETGRACLFLADDLPAELDEERRGEVMRMMSGLPLQLYLTTTDPQLVDTTIWPGGHKLFHVEHGRVAEQAPADAQTT